MTDRVIPEAFPLTEQLEYTLSHEGVTAFGTKGDDVLY